MRYLGIDYGKKRIGLAMSDERGLIAFPLQTVPDKESIKKILELIKKVKIEKIIVGLPIPFSGGESKQTREVKKFMALLKKASRVPIEFENELLTTRLAKRDGVPEKHLDKAAAAIILQSYLDKHK